MTSPEQSQTPEDESSKPVEPSQAEQPEKDFSVEPPEQPAAEATEELEHVRESLGISGEDKDQKPEKEPKIEISQVLPEQAKEFARKLVEIQQSAWLDSYTKPEYGGITVEDVMSKNLLRPERIQKMEERLEKGIGYCVVAKVGDKIVGFAEGEKGEKENIGVNLHLLEEYRGRGIGSKLMADMLGWLGEDKPITLNVADPNVDAKRLYKRFGFVHNPDSHKPRFAKFPSGKEIKNDQMIRYPDQNPT